jgi:hypothetical protein
MSVALSRLRELLKQFQHHTQLFSIVLPLRHITIQEASYAQLLQSLQPRTHSHNIAHQLRPIIILTRTFVLIQQPRLLLQPRHILMLNIVLHLRHITTRIASTALPWLQQHPHHRTTPTRTPTATRSTALQARLTITRTVSTAHLAQAATRPPTHPMHLTPLPTLSQVVWIH